MFIKYFTLFMISSVSLGALEYSPWLGNVYEFESRASYKYASSKKLDLKNGTQSHKLHANLLQANLSFTASENLSTEIEITGAKTSQHSALLDSMKASFRYLWLNDIAIDPVSFTTGASVAYAPIKAGRGLTLLHHGSCETVLHMAIGKELWYKNESFFRPSCAAFLGFANRASPWAALEFRSEKAFSERFRIDLFIHGERGFGKKKLSSIHHFHGYGALEYRFVDVGLSCTYTLPTFGSFSLTAQKRVQGRFCPKDTTSIELSLLIPFSMY